MPLSVIGAGFGRTGTASLKIALEVLGFGPCYHMFEVYRHSSHPALWETAADGGPVHWESMFGAYRSAVDFPAAAFWRELTAAYPDARVILSDRPAESWYDSAAATILKAMQTPLPASADIGRRRARRMARRVVIDRVFGGRMHDRRHALEVYRRHRAEVIETIPAERLLVHAAVDGWTPLCAFLGVAVPDRPYPRVNDRDAFARNAGTEDDPASGD